MPARHHQAWLLVLLCSLACTASQLQQPIHPIPDNPSHGADVSRTHLVNPMLDHVKGEHAKLLEAAQLARHESLPAEQMTERKHMMEALHAHHKHHRPHRESPSPEVDHQEQHRASHAASHASALLRAQSQTWPDGYLAVCIVVRDQVQDMRYWLEYHKWLGVGKVYIFDHNSTRPVMPAVYDHIRSGFVEYQYFRGELGNSSSILGVISLLCCPSYGQQLGQHEEQLVLLAHHAVFKKIYMPPVAKGPSQLFVAVFA